MNQEPKVCYFNNPIYLRIDLKKATNQPKGKFLYINVKTNRKVDFYA